MLHIHVYGLPPLAYRNLKERIDMILQMLDLQAEAVTTIHPEEIKTESCDGEHAVMPYVRIGTTEPDKIMLIVSAFREAKLHMSVEWSLIQGLIIR
jgi:hypothetical protein